MGSYQIILGWKSSDMCPYQKRRGYTDAHRKEGHVMLEIEISDIAIRHGMPEMAGSHQKLGDSHGNRFSHRSSRKNQIC